MAASARHWRSLGGVGGTMCPANYQHIHMHTRAHPRSSIAPIVRPYHMICCWQHVARNTICKFVWKRFDLDWGLQCETKRSKRTNPNTRCARNTTHVYCEWRGACFNISHMCDNERATERSKCPTADFHLARELRANATHRKSPQCHSYPRQMKHMVSFTFSLGGFRLRQ